MYREGLSVPGERTAPPAVPAPAGGSGGGEGDLGRLDQGDDGGARVQAEVLDRVLGDRGGQFPALDGDLHRPHGAAGRHLGDGAARAYRELGALTDRPRLLVASYFDRLGDALPVLTKAPVEGLALDFTGRASANLDALAAAGGLPGKRLIAGVVDGRNIWINDLEKSLATLGTLLGLADRVDVSASCSLLHVPLDAAVERDIDPRIQRWLSFARQKTAEIVTLAKGLGGGTGAVSGQLAVNRAGLTSRAGSPITRDPAVRARAAAVTGSDAPPLPAVRGEDLRATGAPAAAVAADHHHRLLPADR